MAVGRELATAGEGDDVAGQHLALADRVASEVSGCRAVDLGCGLGWFCRWVRQNGTASALGLDVSEKMLDRARAETGDPAVVYRALAPGGWLVFWAEHPMTTAPPRRGG